VIDRLGRLRCRFITTPVTTTLILAGCAGSGVLDVSFVAPTTNVDGSPANVASYRVYYSTTDSPCPKGSVVALPAPKVPPPPDQPLGFRLTGLTVGKLYFVAVTAVNIFGTESGCTSTVSARARQP
jgi:hypothetical protein